MTDMGGGSGRSPEALRQAYLVERELGDRLRHSAPRDRILLYRETYDELFRRVADHPQHTKQLDVAARHRVVLGQLRYIASYLTPSSHFMEIGAGDCAVSILVASSVERVTAVEVSSDIVPDELPANVEVLIVAGTSVGAHGVDVAFSNQVMEHLHPDDAEAQLRSIFDALAPGGRYVCVTPNRLVGPHDISMYFDDVATGLHLREYTNGELAALMHRAGFRRVTGTLPFRARAVEYPVWPLALLERLLALVPGRLRKRLPGLAKRLINVRLVALK